MKTTIAVLDKKGESATLAVATVLRSLQSQGTDGFCMATPGTVGMAEELERLQKSTVDSRVAMGCVYSRILPEDKPQLAKIKDATLAFEGRIYSPISTTSPLENIVGKLRKEGKKALRKLLTDAEGDFSIVVAEKERILAGRDPLGVQPLYYGENADIAALGSNRRVLWKLGIEEPRSFPPGHVARVDREGFKFTPVKTLVYSKPKRVTMQKAAETLQRLLERSVRMRVRGLREVAVAFSGGLDSSIIAFLAKKCRVNVHLMHVSLRNQPETEDAKRAAEELRLPIAVHLLRDEDVAKVAAKVVGLIEEPDPVKAAIGIPFYWTAERTAEAGFKVLLAGQGADELFGGYQRYVNDYLSHGKEKVRRTMFADVSGLHESNIERDRKICGFHGVELRLPFASFKVAEFALGLPVELKIERKTGSLRKFVLRKVAENVCLPTWMVEKPKRAVQYATGVNEALKKLARKHNATVNEYVNKLFLSQMKENL